MPCSRTRRASSISTARRPASGLRITPTGVKTWFFMYRVHGTRLRRWTIGRYLNGLRRMLTHALHGLVAVDRQGRYYGEFTVNEYNIRRTHIGALLASIAAASAP